MWFKNLCLFRLTDDWNITPGNLEETLRTKPLIPCSGASMNSRGWVPPRDDDGNLVEALGRNFMIALGLEEKILPSSVINDEAKERAKSFESQRGYKPGRKQMRDIKDEVQLDFLPRAFARRKTVRAWIDCENGWLIVDSSAPAAAETLIEFLRSCVDSLPSVQLLEPNLALSATMTEWLNKGHAPNRFSIEDECELCGSEEEKSLVRYVRHPLNTDEVRKHIASGKRASKLALSWNEKLSFVLHDNMQIKRVKFIDVAADDAENESDAEQQFELDFTLMTGEFSVMFSELCEVTGVEIQAAKR